MLIRCSFGGSHMSAKATQCAKVDFQMAVISVHMRLTSTSRLQFSQALRANVAKVARKAEALDASSAKTAIWQRSRPIGLVHHEVNRRKHKATFESKGAQLCPGCQIIGGLDVAANAHSIERAALGKNSSAELNTPWGFDLLKDIAALENSILKADDRKW